MKDLTFRQKVIQGIHDLFYIWKREFGTTFRDQGVLIFFVLVPLVYPLIYAFIYTNETIHEVPTVVVDDSRSSLSREYLRKVDSSPEVSLVSYCADMEEAKLMLKDRRAYGIIYIPSTFSDDIVRGKQTQVSIFCDMSGLLYYKALLTANTNVSLAMNADIKVERSANTTDRQDEITAYPIEYEDVALYNPTNGFAAFLIPAVLVLIIQQTLLLGIGLSAGTAREQNRFRDLVPIQPPLQRHTTHCDGKRAELFHGIFTGIGIYTVCGSMAFQPQPNSDTRCPDSVHPALPGRLYFLCHDSIHCHPQPRNVHAAVRVHLRAAAVPLRHFMAGSCYARFLEVLLVHLPFYLRHQRLRTHQQHGSHTQ